MLAQGMAEVLVHTHFQGIIHGTLHPGHVLVGPHNQIKVMDLGLSWILMDLLSHGEEDVLRPLPYLPPESAKGELLTLSSDLYSLGFMMYEMLTKTTPYAGLPKHPLWANWRLTNPIRLLIFLILYPRASENSFAKSPGIKPKPGFKTPRRC